MQLREYILLNRVVAVTLSVMAILTVILIDQESWNCIHKTITGYECKSCGITRDFLSFLQFDFSNPINQYSFSLFLYFIFQSTYRILIATAGLKLLCKQIKSRNSILKLDRKEVDIKKVIIADAMITFLFGILVFLPFWI